MQKVTPFLWHEEDVIEVAQLYISVFGEDNAILKDSEKFDGTPSGSVKIVTLTLFGTDFRLMSAGPFKEFNEAISFEVSTDDQAETDRYWDGLIASGGEASQCGWLKDRFGVSWQIVPKRLNELLADPDQVKSKAVMNAMLKMEKIIIADLELAYKGEES